MNWTVKEDWRGRPDFAGISDRVGGAFPQSCRIQQLHMPEFDIIAFV